MNERTPQPETMDTYRLGDRTLAEWHQLLTTDRGQDIGHLQVPASRYGRTTSQAAYWALAGEVAYLYANGEANDLAASLDFMMGLAVNDHADLGELVRDHLWTLPQDLADQLDWEEVNGGEYPA